MLRSGLVSITFRKLTPQEIVALVARAGLDGIEWGGDVHVPHGDLDRAREVRDLTGEKGLRVAAYGSYYRAGHEDDGPSFEDVLASARELGAPMIRVWAGKQGSADADDAYWTRVEEDCRRVAAMAEEHGILVVSEFHGGTLTDTNESAVQFLQRVDHPGFGTYWQPPGNRPFDYRLEGLHRVTPWLRGIHCFQWTDNPRERRPLAEGAEHWRAYLKAARGVRDMYVLMEFVAEDDPANFLRDAATLKAWLADVNG